MKYSKSIISRGTSQPKSEILGVGFKQNLGFTKKLINLLNSPTTAPKT